MRLMQGALTIDMSYGYARYVLPCFVREQFYMLGDHGVFCPIAFR